ncbi:MULTISPECIES: hypothetical protein [unclassified Microcoleus]|uniref:hypothetical protein n=1 Tax=unclassified Microcoleus TaxID=2642155 RepID=UPI001D8744F4|nr:MULTISPECIES: hypothetical protein [unclassified Microcoleus]MCC3420170.1 hypothetical protein [Microcoleus sp. PH2017_07_MST_O_A]MCC3431421.1 hypothetical protein [Microcoleus sp. PH2017_04_SCI_O_A]MCC3443023.1 hypothetical protein [Microcoleus sp. PH2017_03_ELD_O_A]MCC3465736.1 hypothetical protein [Microcoleus sp. PH2017_06_SFM_O_A]MCC3503125.1 hypothetical protein [Microcoleus sp. PH2017_19_SFW_U_A]MCC3510054.1 hypothetical protein [Microcoleus sp. PH2017_17_BER_D_A]
MNSLILISPEKAWGFQPILSGMAVLKRSEVCLRAHGAQCVPHRGDRNAIIGNC